MQDDFQTYDETIPLALRALGWLNLEFMFPRTPFESDTDYPLPPPSGLRNSYNDEHVKRRLFGSTYHPVDTIRTGTNEHRIIVTHRAEACAEVDAQYLVALLQKRIEGGWETSHAFNKASFIKALSPEGASVLPSQSSELLAMIAFADAAGLPSFSLINVENPNGGGTRGMTDAHRISFCGYPNPSDAKDPLNSEWIITVDYAYPGNAEPVFYVSGTGTLTQMGVGSKFLVVPDDPVLRMRPLAEVLNPAVMTEIGQAMASQSGHFQNDKLVYRI